MTTEYDLNELIGETVGSITAKLDAMSNEQIAELAAMEAASKPNPRVTLLEAIKAVQTARAAETPGPAPANADAIGALGERIAKLEQDKADLAAALKVAEQQRDAALAQLVEAQAGEATAEPVTLVAAHIEEPGAAHMRVAFAADGDEMIGALPPLDVAVDRLKSVRGGGIILNMEVKFPSEGPAQEVHSVWLLPSDPEMEGALVCRLMAPLPVCGGRNAVLPAGHLVFRH